MAAERLLVCGSRDWMDHETIRALIERERPQVVIEGGARGADRIARTVAEALGIDVEEYAADWKVHGRAAGPIRNRRMLIEGKPDLVVAFTDELHQRRTGTRDMVKRALNVNLPVLLFAHRWDVGAGSTVWGYTLHRSGGDREIVAKPRQGTDA
ncbi:MAG: DUF2493 domain-containing protein [Candidatus Dormibacteraceae bacterium]